MKKNMWFVIWLIASCSAQEFVITPANKKSESRERLKESIADSASDLLKQTTKELQHQAVILEKAETDKDVARIISCIAATQDLLFSVIQELVECDGEDRWTCATKKELAHTRDVFKQLVSESKQNIKNWWQSLAQMLEDALPTRE